MPTTKHIIDDERKYILQVYKRPDFVLDHGEGVYLYDTKGKRYLDFVAGISVNALGYNNAELVKAVAAQSAKLIHCSNLYHFAPTVDLARLIVKNSFADKVFFCNSGTEAMEGAIKFARKWGRSFGKKHKYEIVCTHHSFHGRTLGALSATGKSEIQDPFRPLVPGFKFVDFNNLEAAQGAVTDKTCAIVVEPVQGEGGIYPATKKYLTGLRRLCNDRGILLIFDEVQCGLGRTGTVFAYRYFNVKPDLMTLAKPLGGGLPMGAVLLQDNVAQYIEPGDHGSTFGANPVICCAAQVVLHQLFNTDLVDRVKQLGLYFRERLNVLWKGHPCIRDVRGLGLIVGVELDREADDYVSACAREGLLVCTAGKKVLRFLPPLIIEKKHIDQAVGVLDGVLPK